MLEKVEKCATENNIDYSRLQACFNGDLSAQLQEQAAADSPSDHQYTPWILVNGKLSKSDGDKIFKEVCKAYKGDKPASCSAFNLTQTAKNKTKCFSEEHLAVKQ